MKNVISSQLHYKFRVFKIFDFFGDWWLIPVSSVDRNGFLDKFSTQIETLILEFFFIFLQTVFCNFFTNLKTNFCLEIFCVFQLKN